MYNKSTKNRANGVGAIDSICPYNNFRLYCFRKHTLFRHRLRDTI